ncbi:hypothetical protein LTSEGIV_5028, partial [Salmonella enterica subsp. enterica serovar Give str. S5-487]
MISIKRINSQLTLLTPRSKAVWVRVHLFQRLGC